MKMSEVKTRINTLKTLTFQVSFVNVIRQTEIHWNAILRLPRVVDIKAHASYATPSGNKLLLETNGNSQISRW